MVRNYHGGRQMSITDFQKGYQMGFKEGLRNGRKAFESEVLDNDVSWIYSMTLIELHKEGRNPEQLHEFLERVQKRWCDYTDGDMSENPIDLCERITGMRLQQVPEEEANGEGV